MPEAYHSQGTSKHLSLSTPIYPILIITLNCSIKLGRPLPHDSYEAARDKTLKHEA